MNWQRKENLVLSVVITSTVIILMLLFIALPARAETVFPSARFPQIFSSQAVTNGTSETSSAEYIGDSNGDFSIQYYVAGSGTVKVEYLLSLDGTNYLEPSSASDIATGITNSSGPNSDGRDIVTFDTELGEYMKIKVTETGGTNNATVDMYLGRQ